MKNAFLYLFFVFVCSSFYPTNSSVYTINTSNISFISTATFGKIKGTSEKMTGTLDISTRTFEFKVPACSFEGFFNATQKKHNSEKFV